jgi:hypothetical protein
MNTAASPDFARGVYEGPTPFDDIYTRIVDAMVELDHLSYIADPGGILYRCELRTRAAFAIIQQRAYEAIVAIDQQQDETDRQGGREVAWMYMREDLEEDILGLPAGPHLDLERPSS